MDFNEKDWIDKVKAAKSMKEVSRLILEYPVDSSSTTKDARESSTTEQTPTSNPST